MRWLFLLSLLLLPLTLQPQDSVAIHLKEYTVQEGDYLSKLGGWESIYELNKETIGTDPNLIHPESTIYIPVGSSYIKDKTPVAPNYHLQAWALVIIAALLVAVSAKKKALAPVIHVNAPITTRYEEKLIGPVTDPNTTSPRARLDIGEVGVEGAKGKSWLEEEADEISLPTERIK